MSLCAERKRKNRFNGYRREKVLWARTVVALSSLSTSASASRNSRSISFFSFRACFIFLLRCCLSVGFPLARRSAARFFEYDFIFSGLSTFDSDDRTPSSVLSRRWSKHDSSLGCTLKCFSFIVLFKSRTISNDEIPVRSARKTRIRVARQRSDDYILIFVSTECLRVR